MEVDTVLSAIFNIFFKKFLILFVFSFIAVFIIQMFFYYAGFFEISKISDPYEIMRALPAFMSKIALLSVVSVIVYGVLNSFLINYIVKSDFDPKIYPGDLLSESIGKYSIHMIFFLILSMVIVVAGAFIGIIAFIIGSFVAFIYLGTVLMVGGTIVVVEEKNAIEAIGRAFTLSHKDFWPVLGSVVLFFLIMILLVLIIGAIVAIPIVIMFFDNLKDTGNILDAFNLQAYDIGIWTVVINSVVSAVTYPLYAILSVVLYFKLKYKEDQGQQN